jgi:hypothetical protein
LRSSGAATEGFALTNVALEPCGALDLFAIGGPHITVTLVCEQRLVGCHHCAVREPCAKPLSPRGSRASLTPVSTGVLPSSWRCPVGASAPERLIEYRRCRGATAAQRVALNRTNAGFPSPRAPRAARLWMRTRVKAQRWLEMPAGVPVGVIPRRHRLR